MATCIACGADLLDGSAFCDQCGAAQTEPQHVATPPTAVPVESYPPPPIETEKRAGRWILAWTIAIIVVGLLLLAGGIAYSQKLSADRRAALAAARAIADKDKSVATKVLASVGV